jgi:hypothetical protein
LQQERHWEGCRLPPIRPFCILNPCFLVDDAIVPHGYLPLVKALVKPLSSIFLRKLMS